MLTNDQWVSIIITRCESRTNINVITKANVIDLIHAEDYVHLSFSVVVMYLQILPISRRLPNLALGQFWICPIASGAGLRNMGDCNIWVHKWYCLHNKWRNIWTVCICRGRAVCALLEHHYSWVGYTKRGWHRNDSNITSLMSTPCLTYITYATELIDVKKAYQFSGSNENYQYVQGNSGM